MMSANADRSAVGSWIALHPLTTYLFLAFSTAKTGGPDSTGVSLTPMLEDDRTDPVYEATVQATEEAIINALLAAKTMTGADFLRVPSLPHDRLREVLSRYARH